MASINMDWYCIDSRSFWSSMRWMYISPAAIQLMKQRGRLSPGAAICRLPAAIEPDLGVAGKKLNAGMRTWNYDILACSRNTARSDIVYM